jgi:hypothetical protein
MNAREDTQTTLAAHAARLVLEEGLDYGQAKRKAARALGITRTLPDNARIEDEVRAQIDLFHAHTQPLELDSLRRMARSWMHKLAAHRPHLADAAWRGTATRLSRVHIELYADDPKTAAIDLLNLGICEVAHQGTQDAELVLVRELFCQPLATSVLMVVTVHDADDLRGALKPDASGRTWRGDLKALDALLGAEPAGPVQATVRTF